MGRTIAITSALALAVGAFASGATAAGNPQQVLTGEHRGSANKSGRAVLHSVDGDRLGVAWFAETDAGVSVHVKARGLEPGFHGFHIHGVGKCEPDSVSPSDATKRGAFLSAGGHLRPDDEQHPEHAGDLPVIYATAHGRVEQSFVTDRFTGEEVFDDDGAAFMIHSQPDNYANIPQRYAPDGPDEATTGTGDAGSRVGCGVIEP